MHILKAFVVTLALGAVIAAQAPAVPQAPPVPAALTVPAGFAASVFASDLAGARLMTVSPEGVLLVARRPRGEVVVLPDKGGQAEPQVILRSLTNAHSLAFKDGQVIGRVTHCPIVVPAGLRSLAPRVRCGN